MCLAVPAQITERNGDEAVVDLQGSRLRISALLTPEAGVGDWVLVHAGFAITQLDEAAARETWDYLRQALGDDFQLHDAGTFEAGPAGEGRGRAGAPAGPGPGGGGS
jgi:hydrogenase expression/formation protein HypC